VNLEDHLGGPSRGLATPAPFAALVRELRTGEACAGGDDRDRPNPLHWGKAGWDAPFGGACFDGATEYGEGWCAFGCAAAALDPLGRFAPADGDVFRWRAGLVGSSSSPRDLATSGCCGADGGFDAQRCVCLPAEAPEGCPAP